MTDHPIAASESAAQPPGPRRPPKPAFEVERKVHLLDRLAVIARFRGVAISVFILTTLAMVIKGYTNVRQYRAQARLLIENERAATIPGLTSAPDAYYEEDVEPYYQTQYKILRGRDLVRRIVPRLKLEANPEFNGTATPPSAPLLVVRSLERRVQGLFGKEPSLGPPKAVETPDESALVTAFIGHVAVEPVRGSRLVDVSFTSTSPGFAAEAVNTLVNEYVEQNLEIKLQSTQNMLEWIDNEVAKQETKVEESERQLAEYREKQDALSLDDKNNLVASRLNHNNDELMRIRATRIQKQAVFDQVKSIAAGTAPDAIPAIAQNAQVQAIKSKLVELQREKGRLSERYDFKHPAVVAIGNQIQDAQHQLELEAAKALQSVKNEYETAVIEERVLSMNLEAAKADAMDLTRKGIAYNVMEREANSNRQVYEALLQRENEMRISSNSRSNNVRIVDRAEVPKAPLAPSDGRTWLRIIAVGLIVSLGVVFGLDYLSDTIKTPDDITRGLKMPLLGLVPSVRTGRSLSVLTHSEKPGVHVRWRASGDQYPLLTSRHVPPGFAEAFRTLRASLVSKYPRQGNKIVLVTSAEPLEGKTMIAANVAMALACSGARVLLVDADMRRPGLHRALRLVNDRGLSQLLTGQARMRNVIQRTVEDNLFAITAGPAPRNPSELLASERMMTLLTELPKMLFDWIIIDTPPVLAVADAIILAPEVSGVTFVVSAEMTRHRLAERALETIHLAHPKYVAVVLNKIEFDRNRYYYSRYYGHQYRNYYADAT